MDSGEASLMSSFWSIDIFSSIALRRFNREGDVCLSYFRTAIRPGLDNYKVAVFLQLPEPQLYVSLLKENTQELEN